MTRANLSASLRITVIAAAVPIIGAVALLPATLHAGSGSWSGGSASSGGWVGGSSSLQGIAGREVARRMQAAAEAVEAIRRGDGLFAEKDFEGARSEFLAAIQDLPDAPMTRDNRAYAVDRLAATSNELARQYAQGGRFGEARGLLENVLSLREGDPDAKRLLEELSDSDRYNPAMTPEHAANVKRVTGLLSLAEANYDLALYDEAERRLQDVLRADRYNVAARRMMRRVEDRRIQYYGSAREHMRAKMIRQVDALWEDQIPPAGIDPNINPLGPIGDGGSGASATTITRKLRDIELPFVDFTETTVADALEFLREKSKEHDTIETNPAQRGVNIILQADETYAQTSITLKLSSPVPLGEVLRFVCDKAKLKYKVEQFAVVVVPLSQASQVLYTKIFRVPPDFLSAGRGAGGDDGDAFAADPFGGGGDENSGGIEKPPSAREVLEQRGITFVDGSSAFFDPATSRLIVRNTQASLDLIEAYVTELYVNVSRQIHIMTKFVEVTETDLEELGFDWTLGAFNIGGERVFGAGGTTGNQTRQTAAGVSEFPFAVPGTSSPIGANPLTQGLRFGTQGIASDSIDGFISQDQGLQTTGTQVAPGIFGLSGVFTDPQFQVLIRGLNQKKGVDLMSAPSIVTRSGQGAKIEVVREFIYPTEFDPPEIPDELALLGGNTPPVTPTTPTAFEMRPVGVTLNVEPTIGNDGLTIDLQVRPQVVEFDGFINYGTPITAGVTNGAGGTDLVTLTENRIPQPIFSVRSAETAVTIWDGQTVAIGGLIREDVQTIEDKVPLFGSLPFIGRLFQTKADQHFKRNLMIFVTARLIDPAGQPIRADSEIRGNINPISDISADADIMP